MHTDAELQVGRMAAQEQLLDPLRAGSLYSDFRGLHIPCYLVLCQSASRQVPSTTAAGQKMDDNGWTGMNRHNTHA